MNILMDLSYVFSALISLLLLVWGLKKEKVNFIIAALWLSLLTIILHYQNSGGEILGSYFNYFHAFIYSVHLIILSLSLIYLLLHALKSTRKKPLRYAGGFLSAVTITGIALLIINLWINAHFIETRLPGSPLLQVATFMQPSYCPYRYTFYKIGEDKIIKYMCPNYYGLIPAIGNVAEAPRFVTQQFKLLQQ